MGIPGLTTYISNRSYQFLQFYELHDTYLVIDGNSVACQIYNWYAKCNCVYGGDYDKYSRNVAEFFDSLLRCNVTPLVIFDGGCEDKKLKTVISRTRDRIRTASSYNPISQSRLKFFPLFLKETFKDVLIEKGIRYARCIFEADNAIAAVAKMLNCPVLSFDSDFYIYGVSYIPFNTMDTVVRTSRNDRRNAKQCKIYTVETLTKYFRGLDKSMLPLAAILLGNDYVKRSTFKNFFCHIKLPKLGKRRYNEQQRRIEATLNWLSRYTLNKAIITILSRLPKDNRKAILDIIENVMNSYTKLSANVLVTLGFSQEYILQLNTRVITKSFKFEGDINALTYIEETSQADDSDGSEEEEIDVEITCASMEFYSEQKLIDRLPAWFIDEFNADNFPGYFVDLLIRGLYVCPVQLEDYFQPSSILTSLKIISVISGLLRLDVDERYDYIEYLTRGENGKLMRRQLKRCDSVLSYRLPLLGHLREIPLIMQKGILDNTLNITNEFMYGLPPEWTLYMATIHYWLQQKEEPFKLNCHVYSLLLALLFPIIDRKIGLYRNATSFLYKYEHVVQEINRKRKMLKGPMYSTDITVLDACKFIDRDDCLFAASFYASHFETDKSFFNPRQYNISIVHAFNEFQNCLRHSMNLNALLKYPYPQTKLLNVYNGTLLYNFCSNLKRRNDPEFYINSVLQNSPTVLRLFHVLSMKVKTLIAVDCRTNNKVNNYKKQKVRAKMDKFDIEEYHVEKPEPTVPFYDANNPYTLLDTV